MPDCFAPPNAVRRSRRYQLFTHTIPASIRPATRCARCRFVVHTDAASPYAVFFTGGGEHRSNRECGLARNEEEPLPPRGIVQLVRVRQRRLVARLERHGGVARHRQVPRDDAAAVRTMCREDPALGNAVAQWVGEVLAHRLRSSRTRLLDLYAPYGAGSLV